MKTRPCTLAKVTLLVITSISVLSSCGKQDQSGEELDIFSSSIIVGDLEWKEVTSLSSSSSIRVNAKAVGDVELPVMGSRCTGFLITEDVVMTNEHCIPSAGHASGVTVAFNHYKGVPKEQWQKYDCSTFIGNNKELDFALLKCSGSPGRKFGVVTLADSAAVVSDEVYVVQQNCDYYSERNCDWSKKYSTGSITKVENEYTHNADTLGGSSGSPVFSKNTDEVVAIHHAGYGNNGLGRGYENYAVPMHKILSFLKSNYPNLGLGGSGGGSSLEDGNDSFASATALSGDNVSKSNLEISSSTDVDYYKFTSQKSGKLTFTISFVHKAGDLDIKVYNSGKSEIAKSESTSNSESVSVAVGSGATYFKVFGYKGAKGTYSLKVKFEENSNSSGNDTFGTADKVSLPVKVNGSISSKTDVDYFYFTLEKTQTVAIDLSFTHSSGDLDLYVYSSAGKLLTKSAGTRDVEKISKSFGAGKYYILVKGYRSATGSYALSVK